MHFNNIAMLISQLSPHNCSNSHLLFKNGQLLKMSQKYQNVTDENYLVLFYFKYVGHPCLSTTMKARKIFCRC